MRQLTLIIAALVCLAGEPAGQSTPAADPVAALLGRIEAAMLAGTPERYLDLLSTLADRPAAASFLTAVATPGLTRVVIRERDRVDLAGTLPGEGYRLLVEVLRESGQRADVTTWRLDVRRRGNNLADWGILSQQVLTTLQGLHRLSLNPRRQFVARDLVRVGRGPEALRARGIGVHGRDRGRADRLRDSRPRRDDLLAGSQERALAASRRHGQRGAPGPVLCGCSCGSTRPRRARA